VNGEHLVGDSLWWDGRQRTGVALRMSDRAVVPIADVPVGAARRRVPGTVLPGLCDAHVHSSLIDLGVLRAGGIAAVWDLGGVPTAVAALAERADALAARAEAVGAAGEPWGGRAPARLPRVRYAGPFLIAPGGYPSDRPWAPKGSCREVRSAADATDAVAEARAIGATLIKATAHTGGPTLPAATLRAIADAAHAGGLPLVVHAEGPGTVAAARDAGADVLAHTPWTEDLDDGLIRTAAERMTWISTLDIHGWGTETPEWGTAIGNLRRFLGYGGSVRYGTDLGNGPLPPAVNPREIRGLQAAGLAPDAILAAMTDPAAEPAWVPGGLDPADTARFADVLATARVLGPEVRPRG
jgi:imidazolonepropionase-like amidohydrolase